MDSYELVEFNPAAVEFDCLRVRDPVITCPAVRSGFAEQEVLLRAHLVHQVFQYADNSSCVMIDRAVVLFRNFTPSPDYSKNGSFLRAYLRATPSFNVTPNPGLSGTRIAPF